MYELYLCFIYLYHLFLWGLVYYTFDDPMWDVLASISNPDNNMLPTYGRGRGRGRGRGVSRGRGLGRGRGRGREQALVLNDPVVVVDHEDDFPGKISPSRTSPSNIKTRVTSTSNIKTRVTNIRWSGVNFTDSDDSDVQIDHFGVPFRTRSQTSSVASSTYNNSTGINIRPPSHKLQCDICNKFYNKSYLKRHMLIHNKWFILCNFIYVTIN